MLAHVPVLLEEVLQFLEPRPDGRYIDATLGAGGHTRAILERCGPAGRVLALDQDESAIELARQSLQSFGSRLELVKSNFREIGAVAEGYGFVAADGIASPLRRCGRAGGFLCILGIVAGRSGWSCNK